MVVNHIGQLVVALRFKVLKLFREVRGRVFKGGTVVYEAFNAAEVVNNTTTNAILIHYSLAVGNILGAQ